jgi:hypothetical protein
MAQFYSGRFRPKNIAKYMGDYTAIKYRSSWERGVMKWLDESVNVISWSSEETVIPYRCATDKKMHRYFMDFKVKFKGNQTYLIEVKPKAQTIVPVKKNGTMKSFTESVMTYAKNQSKWEQAQAYCKDRGWIFEVWTEDTLKSLGIPMMNSKKPKPFKPLKRMRKKPK